MADQARIDSIEVLRQFRAALWKFAEAAKTALGDADSELGRVALWLNTEMSAYWAREVRKRQEQVTRAAEKLREKRIFKDASGKVPSAVEEEKALRVAKRRLEEAEAKAAAVKKYLRVLEKAQDDYKGTVQGMMTEVAHDIPLAVARLDKLSGLLHQYVSLAPHTTAAAGEAASQPSVAAVGSEMARVSNGPAAYDDLPDFPAFEAPRVVLVQTHRPTGLILAADGKLPAEDGNQYLPFTSIEEAERFAQARLEQDAQVEYAIYGADKNKLKTVAREG